MSQGFSAFLSLAVRPLRIRHTSSSWWHEAPSASAPSVSPSSVEFSVLYLLFATPSFHGAEAPLWIGPPPPLPRPLGSVRKTRTEDVYRTPALNLTQGFWREGWISQSVHLACPAVWPRT